MEAKFKVGDIIVYRGNWIKGVPFFYEVIAIHPGGFGNMYMLLRIDSMTMQFFNFDIVHEYCRLVNKTEMVLYGQSTSKE